MIHRSCAIASLLSVPLLAHAARQDGLVGYFTFDDELAPLKNSAPASALVPPEGKKIGNALEMRFAPGKFGRAAVFGNDAGGPDRINDWAVSLGNLDAVYKGSFTVSLWVKIGDPDKPGRAQPGFIMGNKESFNGDSGWYLAQKYADHYGIRDAGSSASAYTVGLESVDGWINFIITVDRTTGEVIYRTNSFTTSKLSQVHKFKLKTLDVDLGGGLATVIGAGSNATYGGKCLVDEVGIWNRVLTDGEILAMSFQDRDHHGRRIPEASSVAWLGTGTFLAGLAALKRRRAKKSA